MISESDEEEHYTVHTVQNATSAAPAVEVSPQHPHTDATDKDEPHITPTTATSASPLARYYRLGTEQRHAFDEHMRRLRLEAQRVEQEREFREQHPFQPVRHPNSADVERPKGREQEPHIANTAALSTTPSPVRPVFDRLAAQAVQLELRRRHREEQKRRAEAAALRDAFQPEINHRPPAHSDPLHPVVDIPVEDRLLHYGETVARERQRRQAKKAQEEQAALAAEHAAVVGSSEDRPTDPAERQRLRMAFEQRNERFVAERAQRRQLAQAEAAEAYSFQPQISATSAALDEARQREMEEMRRADLQALLQCNRPAGNASCSLDAQSGGGGREASRRSDALYAQAVARQRQQSEVRRIAGDRSATAAVATAPTTPMAADATETHQPQTNPTSARWIATGPHRHFFEQNFVKRQALYEQVKAEEANLKAAAATAAKEGSRASASASLLSGRGGGSAASPRKAVTTKALNERLYYGARKASETAQRRREASANAHDCPFRPSLAPGTPSVLQRMKSARDRDVVRRLTATDAARPAAALDPEKKELYEVSPSPSRQRTRTTAAAAEEGSTEEGLPTAATVTTTAPAAPSTVSPRRRVVVSRDQVEHFYQRQLNFLQERQDLIQERREGEAMQELVECTFRPRTNAELISTPSITGDEAAAPSVRHVTGVSGFLERQKQARQRKAEHDELVRTMGLPRNTARPGSGVMGGLTLLSPFTLQTSQRRRRTSCSPAGAQEEGDTANGRVGEAAPVWRTALSSSERALYDALAETQQYPAVATGPLFPLPGYAPPRSGSGAEEDAVYFDDDLDTYAADWASGAVENAVAMPRPSTTEVRPTRRGEAAAAAAEGHTEKVSLFSSLSPNTFTGRSLAMPSPSTRGLERESRGGPQHAGVKPSALKKAAAAAELTASAQRRKERRTVSFVVNGSSTSPRVAHRGDSAPVVVPRADRMHHSAY